MKSLLQSFVDLCDRMVEEAYVVTDGYNIAGIVLMEDLAHHICQKVVAKSGNPEQAAKVWVVCSIPNALRYAFECGHNHAMQNLILAQQNEIARQEQETCEEVSPEGEKLAQDEIREKLDEAKFEIRDEPKDS